ncbi:MAG: DUF3035 domain-containing protein [Acetobacteraceae bacterium]|nr:DUF3035 domain-containing protein [Pseudomonadota bacterium]
MPIYPRRPRLLGPLLAACSLLLLSGCGGSSLYRTFGLTRDAPDEFTVTTRAPLSMPPDFALRPPRPGAPRPQEQSERQAAEEALVPDLALNQPQAGSSPGQSALMAQTGPSAPADIRRKVDQDARYAAADESLVDKILYWRKPNTQQAEVDPQKESQRLRQNAALGQSPDVGDTPIIQQKQKGWLSFLPWM